MQIKANIPILQQRQIWSRNEQFKHWGQFRAFKFIEGEPSYLVSSYSSLALIFSFALLFTYIFVLQIKEYYIVSFIRAILLIIQVYASVLFYKTNPGISSHSLPIINQLQLIRYKSFCVKCKCMQDDRIKHCQLCNVCIQSPIMHSNILKTCITSKNVKSFCLLWSTILLSSAIYLIV